MADLFHGSCYDPAGLDLGQLLDIVAAGGSLDDYPGAQTGWDSLETIRASGADAVVEVTVTDLETGEPAISHCRAAFEAGAHLVTSNKGPVALKWRELASEADARGVQLRFEGTVMSGTPVLSTAAEALARYRGSFKTPVLRNLQRTGPYMHNGAYESIDSAVREILRINQMARAGEMVGIDEEYRVMNLSEGDVPALVAFLKMFDEVPVEDFRDLLIDFEEE